MLGLRQRCRVSVPLHTWMGKLLGQSSELVTVDILHFWLPIWLTLGAAARNQVCDFQVSNVSSSWDQLRIWTISVDVKHSNCGKLVVLSHMILTFTQGEPHRRQAALWPWRSSPSERLPMQPGGVATLHGALTALSGFFSGKMRAFSKACKVKRGGFLQFFEKWGETWKSPMFSKNGGVFLQFFEVLESPMFFFGGAAFVSFFHGKSAANTREITSSDGDGLKDESDK